MGKVILNISMSLDGFIAGPNVRAEEPMGDSGKGDKYGQKMPGPAWLSY